MGYGFGYLNDMIHRCGSWADVTFSKATPSSICEHLRREVVELKDRSDDVEEAADCMLLLFHLAHKRGWNLEQAVINKFEKNQKRKWGEPDAHGVVEHVREA
jgi:NTP pyrophosphatase (non-canonical NTP hydrolase)